MKTSANMITPGKFAQWMVILGCVAMVLQSCTADPLSPGVEYMPDMYRSPSFETYSGNGFYADSMAARKPVAGTIPRGFLPYAYPQTNDGYEMAGQNLKNPIPYSKDVVEEGKVLYTKFCIHCHGEKGAGNGKVTESQYWEAVVPNYKNLMDLPEGKMFHSITYGKGVMGSHASQVPQEDRWKIIHYIHKLQGKEQKEMDAAADDSSTEETADAAVEGNEEEGNGEDGTTEATSE